MRFDKLDLSTCTEPLKNIEPNESIKRIIVGDTVKFSMPSLQFFVQKFRVLEEFYMDRFVGPNEMKLQRMNGGTNYYVFAHVLKNIIL